PFVGFGNEGVYVRVTTFKVLTYAGEEYANEIAPAVSGAPKSVATMSVNEIALPASMLNCAGPVPQFTPPKQWYVAVTVTATLSGLSIHASVWKNVLFAPWIDAVAATVTL